MSNLLKTSYMNIGGTEKRIIDTNELAAKRIDDWAAKQQSRQAASSGFVSGLQAEQIDLDALDANVLSSGDAELSEEEQQAALLTQQQLQANADEIIGAANAQADEILQEARRQADQLIREAQDQIAQLKGQAMAEGHDQGYADGQAQAMAQVQAQKDQLEEQGRQMEELYQSKLDEIEPMLVDTITDIYEHIFRVDLKAQREVLVHLIAGTLEKVESARSYLIHVSRANYDYVTSRKKALEEIVSMPGSVLEIVEDVSLGENDCMIETEGGIFDCGLGTELSELAQKLKLLSYTRDR